MGFKLMTGRSVGSAICILRYAVRYFKKCEFQSLFISNESTLHCRAVQYLLKNWTSWIFTLALLWSTGSDIFASLILFPPPGNFLFGSANLYHLNFDQVKLNRSFIDCILVRKSPNGTFASLNVSKSLQTVFKIDVIAI